MEDVFYIVHTFNVHSIDDDPDIHATEHLINWEKSEAGQWAMAHAKGKPIWHRVMDPNKFGYLYSIHVVFTHKDYAFWKLKYE